MLFRARSAPFCAHSRNLGTKVLLFFDICKHSALFLSFSLIFIYFPSFLSLSPSFLSLSSSFYVVYVHYPECHSGSLLRPLVGDLIAALSPAFDRRPFSGILSPPFPRHLMPVVPFGGIFAVRFASPVS
jgi:hypothetical protein